MDSATRVFQRQAESLRPVIELELQRTSQFGAGCPPTLQAAVNHSLLAPGKRLRPILVLSAAEACGSPYGVAMPAACAIEMVHTYSLIHDDLPAMDDDDLRRGRPSCHAAFGEATAILAGDALLTRAFEVLAAEMESSIAASCILILSRAAGATQMVGGQADDLAAENLSHETDVDQQQELETLESIHRRKTGAMLVASLKLGAVSAGASADQTARLAAYGDRLGLAFQIIDDLLDSTGEATTLGKRTGQDSAHGKLTFPSLLGIDESRRRAHDLIHEAVQQLETFGPSGAQLESLAHFVLKRDR